MRLDETESRKLSQALAFAVEVLDLNSGVAINFPSLGMQGNSGYFD